MPQPTRAHQRPRRTRGRHAARLALAAWLVVLSGGLWWLSVAAPPASWPPVASGGAAISAWARDVGVAGCVETLVRLVAMAAGAWLLATSLVTVVHRGRPVQRCAQLIDALTLPFLRHLAAAALGASVTMSLAGGPDQPGVPWPQNASAAVVALASLSAASVSAGGTDRATPPGAAAPEGPPGPGAGLAGLGAPAGGSAPASRTRSAGGAPAATATGGAASVPLLIGLPAPAAHRDRGAPSGRQEAPAGASAQQAGPARHPRAGRPMTRRGPEGAAAARARLPAPPRRESLAAAPVRQPVEADAPAASSAGARRARHDVGAPATWVVRPGDDLWAIAATTLQRRIGHQPTDAEIDAYFLDLVEANEARLVAPGVPDLIYPGQVFVLPEAAPGS